MEYKKFVMLVGVLSTMSVVHVEAAGFKDVPQKHWAFEEVHWLRADGMLEGWGGKFHGKRQFTRYEMAKVLGRYMGKYEVEKKKVEKQLGELRSEDQQQRARLDDLGGRTSALEKRLGIQSPMAMASPVEAARPSAPPPAPARTFEPSTPSPTVVTDDMIAGPPPSLVAPIETAPTVPVDEAESAAVERLATPQDTQPAPQELSLRERIALMRRRMEETRQARPAPGGTGSGVGVDASTSAPLPGMSTSQPLPGVAPRSQPLPGMSSSQPLPGISDSTGGSYGGGAPSTPGSGTGDGRVAYIPPPTAPASGGLSDDELAQRVQAALGDLDSMPSLEDLGGTAPPPVVESGSARDGSTAFSSEESGRYDAIRERYMRLMRASDAAPSEEAPAPPPMLPSMTGSTSDFDFQPLPGEDGGQPLPGSDSQPLPEMGGGSQPLPGMGSDQPLPGMKSSSIDGVGELELPDVGMPGLDYIEGTD